MSKMQGADVEALRRLSTIFSQAATTFQNANSAIGRDAKRIDWRGNDADTFRAQWNAVQARMLVRYSTTLESYAHDLTRNANEQEATSGGGSTFGIFPGENPGIVYTQPYFRGEVPSWVGGLETGERAYDIGVDGLNGAINDGVNTYFVEDVSGYTRANGTVVDDYVRFKAGYADRFNPVGSAETFSTTGEWLERAGKVGVGVGFVVPGIVQGAQDWNRDDLSGADKAARIATRSGFVGGGAWAGAEAGGAAGAGIGAVAGLGVADWITVPVGGAVGGIIGGIAGSELGGWVADRFSWMDD